MLCSPRGAGGGQLGTDCTDCGVREVATLPVRELGFRAFGNQQPSIGLGEAAAATFVASATFEECAALCDEWCVAMVRRDEGANCWLIPATSYPGGDVVMQEWTGGTTYVKLPECAGADDPPSSCSEIWGVPCPCEEYTVQNTVVVGGWEYAALDDVAPQEDRMAYGGRCPNAQPNCDGSTCADGLSGQNYYLRLPCGWDFFALFPQKDPSEELNDADIQIWENVVTLGWGTSCINDLFSGSALWSSGPNAGYDASDYQGGQIRNECGQVHEQPTYSTNSESFPGWYYEFSPAAGVRSVSCGRRFLIRRPVNCVPPVRSAAAAEVSGCSDMSDAEVVALTEDDSQVARQVGSCEALVTVLRDTGGTCDALTGPSRNVTVWDACCATCERKFGVHPERQPDRPAATNTLQLKETGGAQDSDSNWARKPTTLLLDSVFQHVGGHSGAFINDGVPGQASSWSGGQAGAGSGALAVGFAFSKDDFASSSVVLVDEIAFGRDATGAFHDNYAGSYTIQISQYKVTSSSQANFVADFSAGVEQNEQCVEKAAVSVPADAAACAAVALGAPDSQSNCESIAACTYRGQWQTIDTLIYDSTTPPNPWDRHLYRLQPPVPATAIRIVTSSPSIVIDELEVYGTSPMSPNWVPEDAALNSPLVADLGITDSTGATTTLITGDPAQHYVTAPGAEVVVEFSALQVIYEVAFSAPSVTDDPNRLFIRRCKVSFVDQNGIQQFVTDTSISTRPSDAAYILALGPDDAPDSEMFTDTGLRVALPVPIETSHVRFYDIQGKAGQPVVKVQFGIYGKESAAAAAAVTGEPQLDVTVAARGFDSTVGCDTVEYVVTIRHKPNSGGALAQDLRLTDMLSDPKLVLISGSVDVRKSYSVDSEWQTLGDSQRTFHAGNTEGDTFVMADVANLYKDQVLQLIYRVQVLDPEPRDIISTMAAVELLTHGPECAVDAALCECGPDNGCFTGEGGAGCGVSRQLIAKHTLNSDIGSLSFASAVSHGDDNRPLPVTVDGRTKKVFLIKIDIDALLSAGVATNVLLSVTVPEDRQKYFELLSVDNLDNTGSRSAVSDDDAVLLMDRVSVLTESITVPCSEEPSPPVGLSLSLTGALYNSFYYSEDYTCQLSGCSELSLQAVLEYDLVSSTIYHGRLEGGSLYNATRSRGASLPRASVTPLGVHYSGGHPTWPLFTLQLENKELPGEGGYEGTVRVEGSFEGMNGRLSVIVSGGGTTEFYITRNPLQDGVSFGSIGTVSLEEKVSVTGADWDLTQVIASSTLELRIKVVGDATFLTGTIDGHVATTMLNATIQMGDGVTISVYKELESDDLTLSSVDSSFVCTDCTVRHSETHAIEVARPGAPPDDIVLTSAIVSGDCGQFDACVIERAVENTKVASIAVSDADWSIGDANQYEIVEQSGDGVFRLSSEIAYQNDEVWLEVAADRVPEFQSRELYEVLITVRDNLWLDHYFTKRVVVRVLAYPQLVELSPGYLVQEGAAAGTVVGDLACFDPDQGQVSFGLSGDDAGLFRIDGSQLLAAANLPRLVTQGFYDIVVTCTDWNGLSYDEVVELTSFDLDECATTGTCSDGANCLNSIGSYQCLCDDGFMMDESDACVEVDECAVYNGSCGDEELVECQETAGGGFTCVDIDECSVGNGGCGDAAHARCINEHAAPPTCEDICECANAPCAGDGCTDYNKAAVACSTTTGFASEVQAGTEVSVAVSGNVARDVVEVYAIRSPLAESGEKVQWVPVAVSVEAAPAGCAQDSGDCQVNAVVTPSESGSYYVVFKNQGRNIQGTPLQMNVAAVPTIASVQVSGDGLVGGAVSDPSYVVKLAAFDSNLNPIVVDIAAELSAKVTVYVCEGAAAACTVAGDLTSSLEVQRSSSAGSWDVLFNFFPKPVGQFAVVVLWDGAEVASTDTFTLLSAANLAAGNVEPAMTTVATVGSLPVAGTEGTFHVQTRDASGIPLQFAPDVASFGTKVTGPALGATVELLDLSREGFPGVISGRFSSRTAGTYTATVTYGGVAVGSVEMEFVAAPVVPTTSTVAPVRGPFPVDPSRRTGIAGETMKLRLVPRDDFGNENRQEDLDDRVVLRMTPLFEGAEPVTFSNVCEECDTSCVSGMISRDSTGAYIGSYAVDVAGLYELSVELDGVALKGMPTKVNVGPSTAVSFSGTTQDGHFTAAAGQVMSMPLVFSDKYENSGAFPAGSVFVKLTHKDPSIDEVIIPPVSSGSILTVDVSFRISGDYRIEIRIDDTTMLDDGLVQVLPGPGLAGATALVDAASGSRADLGSGISTTPVAMKAGVVNTLEVTLTDTFDNVAAGGGSHVTAVLGSVVPGVLQQTTVGDYLADGVYSLAVKVSASVFELPGVIQLRVFVDTTQVFLAPVSILEPLRCSVLPLVSPTVGAGDTIIVTTDLYGTTPNAVRGEASFSSTADATAVSIVGSSVGSARADDTIEFTTEIQRAGTYSISVAANGDTSLCEAPPPFVVVSSDPDPQQSSLSAPAPSEPIMVGAGFSWSVTSYDRFSNKVEADPFNPTWTPIVVSVWDEATDTPVMECVQLPAGQALPVLAASADDVCFVDSLERGVVAMATAGEYSLRAELAGERLSGSPVAFSVEAWPEQEGWSVEVVQPQLEQQKFAGSAQRLTLRVQEVSTGIFVTAEQVAIAWLINTDISATCCAICSCQERARVSSVVAAAVDSGIQLISREVPQVGAYTIHLELVSSDVVEVAGQIVVVPGEPVAAMYSLESRWEEAVDAGTEREFTLLARDVFGNRVPRGGDLISANAIHASTSYIAAGYVTGNADGSYTVSYRPTLSGEYDFQVERLGDGPIPHHPWLLNVGPGGVDPALTTLDPLQLQSNAHLRLQLKDSYGNAIDTKLPGVAFSYTYQFSDPAAECGSAGQACVQRGIVSAAASRNEAPNIGAAVDGQAEPSSPVTWLTQGQDAATVEVRLELETPNTINRLRVVTFPDAVIEAEGKNEVTISVYHSLDGAEWTPVDDLTAGYLGTEMLPRGASLDAEGPTVGGAHLDVEGYVDAWSVMFLSRFVKYLRLDITAAASNPATKYPVRELQLFQCLCAHGTSDTGILAWDDDQAGYAKTFLEGGFPSAGVVTLSVMFGLEPIAYVPGYSGEPYVHIVGEGGDSESDTELNQCLRFYNDEVVALCDAASYCTPSCYNVLDTWMASCDGFGTDFRGFSDACLRSATYDASQLQPSLVIPGTSDGITDGMLAGEKAQIQMLLADPDGKTVTVSSQWLEADLLDISVGGPSGAAVETALSTTIAGVVNVEFTPKEVGTHTISVRSGGDVVLATTATVVRARTPFLETAKFSPDGAVVFLSFIAPVSVGRGSVECDSVLRSDSVLLLGSQPICSWHDARTLAVTLGYAATLAPGDVLSLVTGAISRVDYESDPAFGSSVVHHPDVGERPAFCIPDRITLGACEDLDVRPGCQSGGGGRDLTFEYVLHPSALQLFNAEGTPTQDFDSADARLLVSADYFAVDETYEVFVRATNFMGYRSMQKSVLVTRGADNSLPVSIRGGSDVVLDSTDYLYLSGSIGASPGSSCSDFDQSQVTFEWTQIAGDAVDSRRNVQLDEGGVYLYVGAGVMRPGEQYTFQLTGRGPAGTGQAAVSVRVRESPLVARIDGCDRTVTSSEAVRLSGRGSVDPDTPDRPLVCSEGNAGCQKLESIFRWKCRTYPADSPSSVSPCMAFSSTDEVLTIGPDLDLPPGSLAVGNVYELTLEVQSLSLYSGIKSAQATASITPVDTAVPQVLISSLPFSRREAGGEYAWNSNENLVLVGASGAGVTGPMEFRWRFLEGGTALAAAEFSAANRALTLPRGTLMPRQKCVLQLEGRVAGGTAVGVASVTFVIGRVPSAGDVSVGVSGGSNGISLETTFTFDYVNWAGAAAYRLFYEDCTDVPCVTEALTMSDRTPQISTRLSTAPIDPVTGVVTVVAVAVDKYGSSSSKRISLAVQPNAMSCTQLADLSESLRGDLQLSLLGGFAQLVQREYQDGGCRSAGADEIQRRVRWQQASTFDNSSCVAEVQERLKPTGFSWGRWSGDFEEESCSQSQTRVRFEKAVVDSVCQQEEQLRVRDRNEPWGPWTRLDGSPGQYAEVTCKAVETRLAWRQAQTEGEDCQSAEQYKVTISNDEQIEWAGLYDTVGADFAFESCVETESATGYTASESRGSACEAVVQRRSRSNGGSWSQWQTDSGLTAVSTCTEVQSRYRYESGVASCGSVEEQERSRVAGEGESSWSSWAGTQPQPFTFPACIDNGQSTATTVTKYEDNQINVIQVVGGIVPIKAETRERFRYQLAEMPAECEAETQVRTTGVDGEWQAWSGSYEYISCAQVDIQDRFQRDRAEVCVSQKGVRAKEWWPQIGQRTCPVNSACDAASRAWVPSSGYTGDFDAAACAQFSEKTSYYASGFGVREDFSPLGVYACDGQLQTREIDSATGEWGPWDNDGAYTFDACDFPRSRKRWLVPVAGPGGCESELQTRAPVSLPSGETSWTPWSGTYSFDHCTERERRYRYSSQATGCTSTVESRWRTDMSQWFGDAWMTEQEALSASAPFPYIDCPFASPQERIAFSEGLPSPETGCLSEKQTRPQTDAGWGAWSGTFEQEICVVIETRTRWNKAADGCQSELQSRYRDGHDEFSSWTGEFTDSTCEDTRVRYLRPEVGDGAAIECVDDFWSDSNGNGCDSWVWGGSDTLLDCADEAVAQGMANPTTGLSARDACCGCRNDLYTCVSEVQTMAGSADGSIVWTGTPGYVHETCEEVELVTRWLSPLTWDGPCESAQRTRRRADGTEVWGSYSEPAAYIYEHCTQYESRERYSAVAGDPELDNVCRSEPQVRGCTDCSDEAGSAWSPWSGTLIYPLCDRALGADARFDLDRDVQTRVQYQTQVLPCVNETQARVKLPDEAGWTPWSGDFVYARCPFTGVIQEREAWFKSFVDSPEVCIPEVQTRYQIGDEAADSWSEWYGDFRYTSCTETETRTFYQSASPAVGSLCVPAQQTRQRMNRGAFGEWSGSFVDTNCTESRERLMWTSETAVDGEVCESQLQTQSRQPGDEWSAAWEGEIDGEVTYESCTEIQTRTRWEAASTATECTFEVQQRTREDGGTLSPWDGTFVFETCTQTEERTMYDSDLMAPGERCNSEIQTRDNVNQQGWSEWTGDPLTFMYDQCVPGAPTVETRIRWETPVSSTRCRSEVQQRTVEEGNLNPPWGGTFTFSACTQVEERFRYEEPTALECVFEKQERFAPGNSESWGGWSGVLTEPNCTETRVRWQQADDTDEACVSEVQSRSAAEDNAWSNWTGTFAFEQCDEVESVVRWESSSAECQSEIFVDGRLKNPSGDCGKCNSEVLTRSRPAGDAEAAWSAWEGTDPNRPTYVFEQCVEVDMRRRYQYARRNVTAELDGCTVSSEAQTRTRTNNGEWSPWSGTPEFFYTKCQQESYVLDAPRVRWFKPDAEGEPCVSETQVRNEEEGSWDEWSGSYVYATCTEYETATRYAASAAVDTPCRSAVARRQRVDGGEWADWNTPFNFSSCRQTEHRTAWKEAETVGAYAFCESEAQTRTQLLPDDDAFTAWDGFYVEPHCTQRETRMRWESPATSTFSCNGELQNRTRVDNGDWSCWDGSFLFDYCKQTQERKRYSEPAAAQCDTEVQVRERYGYAEWGAWTGSCKTHHPIKTDIARSLT